MDAEPASVQLVRATQRLRTTYATVLRKAGSEDEVAEWIDREMVVEHWDVLNLPPFVREAWEAAHDELRQQ